MTSIQDTWGDMSKKQHAWLHWWMCSCISTVLSSMSAHRPHTGMSSLAPAVSDSDRVALSSMKFASSDSAGRSTRSWRHSHHVVVLIVWCIG